MTNPTRGGEGFPEHGCRTYWGHCGCDLYRGHAGPHVGLHFNDEMTRVTETHWVPADYPHTFGEDAKHDDEA